MLMNLISIMLHAHYCVCVYITVCVGGMYTQSLSDVVYIRFHSLCMCNYTHLYIHGACMYVCMYIVPIRLSVLLLAQKVVDTRQDNLQSGVIILHSVILVDG